VNVPTTPALDPRPARRRGPRHRRPPAEIAAAIARLRAEEQIPVAALDRQPLDLAGCTVHPTASVLIRWGCEGRRGVFLDVLRVRRSDVWVTSAAALARFVRDVDSLFWAEELAARTNVKPEGGAP
jgi:hypothetical protein